MLYPSELRARTHRNRYYLVTLYILSGNYKDQRGFIGGAASFSRTQHLAFSIQPAQQLRADSTGILPSKVTVYFPGSDTVVSIIIEPPMNKVASRVLLTFKA
jgi:hypothetical protein